MQERMNGWISKWVTGWLGNNLLTEWMNQSVNERVSKWKGMIGWLAGWLTDYMNDVFSRWATYSLSQAVSKLTPGCVLSARLSRWFSGPALSSFDPQMRTLLLPQSNGFPLTAVSTSQNTGAICVIDMMRRLIMEIRQQLGSSDLYIHMSIYIYIHINIHKYILPNI